MNKNYETYEEALKERHGKMLSCSSSSSSGGMMANSNSLLNYHLDIKDNDGSILTVENKKPFEKAFRYTYRIKDEDLKDLYEYIEENRFWAFSRLETYQDPRFVVYDYSSNSGFSLCYDDTSIGGKSYVYLHIDRNAMHQYKFDKQALDYDSLICALEKKGELLTSEESGHSSFFPEDPETVSNDIKTDSDGKRCPCCGYRPVSGRFCPECGSEIKN